VRKPWTEAARLQRQGTPFVVVTMIASRGHAPQDPGAKALFTADGLYAGTVGGGKVEAKCIELARTILADSSAPPTQTFTWNLQRDIGMTCGGEVTYLFEKIAPAAWRVIVFGAGHVAQKVARYLRMLDCRATFVDPRPEWVARFPKAPNLELLCTSEPPEYVAKLKSEAGVRPYFVIMTRGHASDMPVLREIWKHFPDAPYTGVLGSEVKALKIRNEMKAEGWDPALIAKLHCPMGLPFGTNDPAEIALSIVAHLVQVRDQEKS
jgi:xanthine dehydrogenase accessory factor